MRASNNRLDALHRTVGLFGQMSQALKPPPKLSISEWAEQYRVVSTEEAAAPGKWYNDHVPYMVEVMDAISDLTVREVVLMCASQMGKTNVLANVIAYHMHLDPCPIMMVQPTIALGESWSGKRFSAMLRDTPCLRGLVPDEKSRTPGNTILEKTFTGGYLTIAGANSAPSLKGRPIRIVLFDEVDEAPRDLSGQGDPVKLAAIRTTGFPNRKLVLASTPTIKGKSRIETAYNESTREVWAHCCPSCGEWSAFSWRRLKFETLEMVCPNCGAAHTRREWLRHGGKWLAENPYHSVRGFHVTALDAPTLTWTELVDEWIEAERRSKSGDHAALITFVNTRLAETWEIRGEAVERHALESRREVYRSELPDGVCYLTAGVDVQDSRLAVGVWGWGLGFENWSIEYAEYWGDPRRGEVWNRIDDLLARSWSYGNGRKIRISRMAVDTGGHATPSVYDYCKARESRGVYAVKGQGGDKVPMTRPSKNSRYTLFMVGVDGIKADLMSWLSIGEPGNGYCHFPKGDDDEPVNGIDAQYFSMLTAEKRIAKHDKRGFTSYEWIKPSGARNEAWDVFIYSRAALRIMSNKDDLMLKRMHLLAPWNGSVDAETSVIVEQPKLSTQKPKQKVNRNAVAATRGVQL